MSSHVASMFVYQQLIGSCDTVKLVIIIETVINAVFSCGGFELWLWLLLHFVPFRGSALCVYCGATGEENPGGEAVVVGSIQFLIFQIPPSARTVIFLPFLPFFWSQSSLSNTNYHGI